MEVYEDSLDDLEECEYGDACDFCDSPGNGSYAKVINDQCGMETLYIVCGKCLGLDNPSL